MKKVQILFLMLILSSLTLVIYAQEASWNNMQEFHTVMGKTFHASEDDNLKPLRENAVDLLSKAIAWQKSTVPPGYKAPITKPILKRLVKQCKKINEAVNTNQSDAELKIMITEAHEIFHEIKEKCLKPDH